MRIAKAPIRFRFNAICVLAGLTALCTVVSITAFAQQRMSISEARKDANRDFVPDRMGEMVTTAGRASVGSRVLHTSRLSVFIQDDSAGIEMTANVIPRQIREGDSIVATGKIDQYEGVTQLIVSELTIIPAGKRSPIPLHIAIPRGDMEQYEGRLLAVEGYVVGKKNDQYGDYLTIQDVRPDGGSINVFLSRKHIDTLSFDGLAIGDHLLVTGLLQQYATTSPMNGEYEIHPRYPGDLTMLGFSRLLYERAFMAGGILIIVIMIWLVVSRVQVRSRTKELDESEKRFKAIFDRSPDGIFLLDPASLEILDCNDKACTMYGYRREELVGLSVTLLRSNESLAPPDEVKTRQQYLSNLTHDAVTTEEGNYLRKDGTIIPIESSVSLIELGGRHVIMSVDRDISERTEAEKVLHASGERFRSVWYGSSDGMRLTNRDGFIVDVNAAYCTLVKMPREKLLGQTLSIVYMSQGPDDDLTPYQRRFDAGEVISGFTVPAIMWNGETIDLEISSSLIETAEGGKMCLGIFRDITERNKTEKLLRMSLQEKSILLKEIHHRVKNNMQVISSLLNLQEKRIADEGLRELFKESQFRIRSMALVHEKLYQSDSLAQIDFGEYLDSLAAKLFRSFGGHRVVWRREGSNIRLGADTAIPCGLIVNELITNAMKHAFPDNKEGVVTATMRLLPENRCELIVTDNGIGMPADLNIKESTSLGMQLIESLVEQLGGTVIVSAENGTRVTIVFPVENVEAGLGE
ncbi:MAG: PAS domain S-box protein [Ignavibacteriales bacterium]|nr:PAS domain S-box protein [Ignavibacteriales bacterium]